jgi:glucose-6-phosphate dehydrogenase assembly protein OpcA
MPAVSESVWSAEGTTPDAIDDALRALLAARHAEDGGYVPARVLNMIAFVDRKWSGEIANRLHGVGRYHASRLIVLSYEPARERIDAHVTLAADGAPRPGELSLLRETVVVEVGGRHLDDLPTIAAPLLVSDLPTLLWSPHGHHDVVDTLLPLAQAVLIDSIDEPVCREAVERARALSKRAYVVDLAWLRTTPWRERVAASFDPRGMRGELSLISALTVRHHPDSTVVATLLAGWLASSLGWEVGPLAAHDGALRGRAGGRRQEVAICLRPDPGLPVRGLASMRIETASGLRLGLDRGPGGLRAGRTDPGGTEREWTLLGASRGEAGVLGEGIRQALLRDPAYAPALACAAAMTP